MATSEPDTSPPAADLAAATAALAAAGFRLSVSACTCCESPHVELEHNGRRLLNSALCNIEMAAPSEGGPDEKPFLPYHSTRSIDPAPEPMFSELGMYLVLRPIVAEFDSDPMSVQCFDLRIVRRAQWLVKKFEGRFGPWMEQNKDDVATVQSTISSNVD